MQCETALAFDDKFQDCISRYAMTYPFHHWNINERIEFEFETRGDAFIGQTSFRGTMTPSPSPTLVKDERDTLDIKEEVTQ